MNCQYINHAKFSKNQLSNALGEALDVLRSCNLSAYRDVNPSSCRAHFNAHAPTSMLTRALRFITLINMSNDVLPTRRSKRKRTEDEPTVPGKPRKHDRFWLDDGNVVLTADDALSFRLHRRVLSLHSEVFRPMFAFLSRTEDNEMLEGRPVIHLQDSGDDLVDFLLCFMTEGRGNICIASEYLADLDALVPFFDEKNAFRSI